MGLESYTLGRSLLILLMVVSYATSIYSNYVPDIIQVIKKSKLEALTEEKTISPNILPGQVSSAKSQYAVEAFSGGIYQYKLASSDNGTYRFDDIPNLKNTNALLHIDIDNDVKNAKIVLPSNIDTVIEGNQLDNLEFFLGRSTSTNNANYYFFANTKPQKKIHLKARGQIYASRPEIFQIHSGSSTDKIIPINLADFFFKHTTGQTIIPANNEMIDNALNTEDDHIRKARPHQIKQLVDYTIAGAQGVKYLTFMAATGSGKTNTEYRLIELLRRKKALIVTPRLNLIDQIINEGRAFYGHLDISEAPDHQNFEKFFNTNLHRNLVTVSLQGFQLNYEKLDLSNFDAIIFDEAHNLLSEKRSKMVNFLKDYDSHRLQLFFFSATPDLLFPHEETGLKSVYQLSDEPKDKPHIRPFTIFNAVDAQANPPFQILQVSKLLKEQWKGIGKEFVEETVQREINQTKFHRVILDFYLNGTVSGKSVFGEKTVIFGPGITYAEALTAYLQKEYSDHLSQEQITLLANKSRDYRAAVLKHFNNDTTKAHDFLSRKGFVFADAVHSGNDNYLMTDQEANDRILRNKLGGSFIFCTATKLMEGYDNPELEMVFLVQPYRRSNIFILQQLGRVLRMDPKNPKKIAKAVQFIWDDRQLLLSSPQLLGVMSYGLEKELTFEIQKHLPDTLEYMVSTTRSTEGVLASKKSVKRETSTNSSETPVSKKQKKAEKPEQVSSKEELIKELLEFLKRVKDNFTLLSSFTINKLPAQQEYILPASSSMQIEPQDNLPTKLSLESKGQTSAEGGEGVAALCTEATSAIENLSLLLRPHPTTHNPSLTTKMKAQPTDSKKEYDELEYIDKIIARAKRILNKAERFYGGAQMHLYEAEFAQFTQELENIKNNFTPLFERSRAQIFVADPLAGKIEDAVDIFVATLNWAKLFERTEMRAFFRNNIWQAYLQTHRPDVKLADATFANLIIALLQRLVTEETAGEMLDKGPKDGRYLLEIYEDSPQIKEMLKSLYRQYGIQEAMELEAPVAMPEPAQQALLQLPSIHQPASLFASQIMPNPPLNQNVRATTNFSRCSEMIRSVLLHHQNNRTLLPEHDYQLLENCIPKSFESPPYNFMQLLADYVALFDQLKKKLPMFVDKSNFICLIRYFEGHKFLYPPSKNAQTLLKVLLTALDANQNDLDLDAYGVALAKTINEVPLMLEYGSLLLTIPIFTNTLTKKSNEGKLAIEYLELAPKIIQNTLRAMYSLERRSNFRSNFGLLSETEDNEFYLYFIERADFADLATVRIATIAANNLRMLDGSNTKVNIIIKHKLQINNIQAYLARKANDIIKMSQQASIKAYNDLYHAIVGWAGADIVTQKGILKFVESHVDWSLAEQNLGQDMAKELRAIVTSL